MKGNITITMNQASMMEAVQAYIDGQFTEKHTVKNIKPESNSAYNGPNTYEVEIEPTAND